MPLSFDQIYGQYQKSGLTDKMSLADFAKLGNFVSGPGEYDQAQGSGFGQAIKVGSYNLNQGINATGVPDALGGLGKGLYSLFGGSPEAGQALGQSLPRSAVNMVPMAAATLLAPETGGLSYAALAGMAGTGALSGAETFEQTGSPGQAAVSAALPFVGMGAGAVAGKALMPISKGLYESSPLLANALQFGGTQAASIGGMEATGRMFGQNQTPFFSMDNALNMVFGNLPFVAHGAIGGLKHGGFVEPSYNINKLGYADVQARNARTSLEDVLARRAVNELPSQTDQVDAGNTLDDLYKSRMLTQQSFEPVLPKPPAAPTPAEDSAAAITRSYGEANSPMGMEGLKAKLADEAAEALKRKEVQDTTILGQNVSEASTQSLNSDTSIAPVVDALKTVEALPSTEDNSDLHSIYAEQASGSSSSMVPVNETWQKYQALNPDATKEEFVGRMQQMGEQGKILTEPLDTPTSGTPEEQSTLIPAKLHKGAFWKPAPEVTPESQVADTAQSNAQLDVAADIAKASIDAIQVPKPEEIVTHEQAAGVLQKANAISMAADKTPVTDAQVSSRVDQLTKDGASPTEAIQRATSSTLTEAKMKAKTLVDKTIEAKKVGRPKKVAPSIQDRAAMQFYADALDSSDPRTQQLVSMTKPIFEDPQARFKNPAGQMKFDASTNVLRAFKNFMENEDFAKKPMDQQVKILGRQLKTTVDRRAYEGSVKGEAIQKVELTDAIEQQVQEAMPEVDKSTDGQRAQEAMADNVRELVSTGSLKDILLSADNPESELYKALNGHETISKAIKRGINPSDAVKMIFKNAGDSPALARKALGNLLTEYATKGSGGEEGGVPEVPGLKLEAGDLFKRVLMKQGVTEEQTNALHDKLFKPLTDLLNLKDVSFQELTDNIRDGKATLGLSTVEGPLRKMWLGSYEGLSSLSAEHQAHALMSVMAHEAGHGLEHLANMGLLDEASMAKWKAMQDDFASRTSQENGLTLRTMAESLLPKWMQKNSVMESMLSPVNGSEASATAHAIITLSKVNPENAEMGATLVSRAARAWFQTVGDWFRRIFGGMKSALFGGPKSDSMTRANDIVKNFQDLKNAFTEAENTAQSFNALFQIDQDSLAPASLDSMPSLNNSSVNVGLGVARMASIDLKSGETGPKNFIGKAARQASRYLESLEQLVRRRPQIAEAGNVVLRMPENKKWINDRIMAPILSESDGKGGLTTLSKERQAQLKLVGEDPSTNRLLSDIQLWEQDQLDNGKNTQFNLTKPIESDPTIGQRFNQTPSNKKDAISWYLTAQRQSNKIAQGTMLDFYQKENTLKLATQIASWSPQLRGQAKQMADNVYNALWMRQQADVMSKASAGTVDPNEVVQLLQQSEQMMATLPQLIPDPEMLQKTVDLAQTMVSTQSDMKTEFEGKPNFGSRIMVGKYIIRGMNANGKQVGAVPIKEGSEQATAQAVLAKRGAKTFSTEEVKRRWQVGMNDEMRDMIDHAEQSWTQKLQETMGPNVDPDLLRNFMEQSPLGAEFDRISSGGRINEPGAKSRSGQDMLDMVEAHRAYSSYISNSLTNRLARANMLFELGDPTLKKYPEQVQQIKDSMEAYMTPDNPVAAAVTRAVATYYLGFSLPTDLAVSAHGLFTILPEAVSRMGSVMDSTKLMTGALKDLFSYYGNRALQKIGANENFAGWHDPQEALVLKNLQESGMLTRHQFSDAVDNEGLGAVSLHQAANRGIIGTAANRAGSLWNAYSNLTMKLFEHFPTFNSRLAAIMGYRMGKAQGMDFGAANEHAQEFTRTSTFASGKAGRPVGAFTGKDHTIGQLAYCMQRYQMGCMAMLGRYLEHGMLTGEGAKEIGITPGQQKAAQKAFATAMGIRFGAAGVLGLPMMGALNAIWGKIFHKELGESIYDTFGKAMDQDDAEGSTIADVATHGFVNAMLSRVGVPLDLASKFAMGGLPGMSPNDGFDPGSIFGPTASFAKSMWTGLTSFGNDRGLVQVGKSVAPPALRKLIDLWANGDATDSVGRVEGLSSLEKTLYAVGFPSQRQSKAREYKHYADLRKQQVDQQEQKDVGRTVDMYNSGDSSGAIQNIWRTAEESGWTKDPSELAHKVAQKIVDRQSPPDPRRIGNPEVAHAIQPVMMGMGLPVGASNELTRMLAVQQIEHQLGYGQHGPQMNFGNAASRASRIDAATLSNPQTPFQSVFAPFATQ